MPDIYDIEPNQIYEKETLPKRLRYYHGLIATQVLAGGADYDQLPNVVIIFILLEKTTADNVTNQEIGNVHRLVDMVKSRREVDISYMKSWEWDKFNRRLGKEEGWRAGRAEDWKQAG